MRLALVAAVLLFTTSTADAEEDRCSPTEETDEAIYDAAVCYEGEHALSAAIRLYELVRSQYPKSKLRGPSMMAAGRLYQRIAWYDQAADLYEAYAKQYPGEKDAYDALATAVYLRAGLGDDEQQIKDTMEFVRLFEDSAADAADAYFSLTRVYEKGGDAEKIVAHLRNYIKKYGAKGGADRVVIAYAKIGALLWAQSCPAKTIDGACVKVVRPKQGKKKVKTCGPPQARLEAVARTAKTVKEATTALRAAISAYDKAGGGDVAARHHYAHAKLLLADAGYEALVALKVPTKAAGDMKKLDAWFQDAVKVASDASADYQDVITLRDPETAIAATARSAQIPQHVANMIFAIEPPSTFDAADLATYCDGLSSITEPMTAGATKAFAACLQASTELGAWTSWSALCERELEALDPVSYPTLREAHAAPTAAPALTSLAGIETRYPDELDD